MTLERSIEEDLAMARANRAVPQVDVDGINDDISMALGLTAGSGKKQASRNATRQGS